MVKGDLFNLVGSGLFEIDLLLILLVYVFAALGPVRAAIFAFGQGLLIDLFSSGLRGLSVCVYLTVFWGVFWGSRYLNLEDTRGQASTVFLAFFLKQGVFFGLVSVFYEDTVLPENCLLMFILSGVITGLMAPPVFSLLNRMTSSISKGGILQRSSSMPD